MRFSTVAALLSAAIVVVSARSDDKLKPDGPSDKLQQHPSDVWFPAGVPDAVVARAAWAVHDCCILRHYYNKEGNNGKSYLIPCMHMQPAPGERRADCSRL